MRQVCEAVEKYDSEGHYRESSLYRKRNSEATPYITRGGCKRFLYNKGIYSASPSFVLPNWGFWSVSGMTSESISKERAPLFLRMEASTRLIQAAMKPSQMVWQLSRPGPIVSTCLPAFKPLQVLLRTREQESEKKKETWSCDVVLVGLKLTSLLLNLPCAGITGMCLHAQGIMGHLLKRHVTRRKTAV